jgi:hypothetical protein
VHSRSSICIKEDVTLLELFWVRPMLEMLLEGVLADMIGSAGGDWGLVDD